MRTKALILLAIISIFISSAVFAAVCPQVESLGVIRWGTEFSPLHVALDSKGNLYVTDEFYDKVMVFSYSGKLIKTVNIGDPAGVAVDSSGRVYISRSTGREDLKKGEVTVYDANLTPLYSLGSGMGEFKYPMGIATDSERVYVADSFADRVKVYDINTGEFLFSFGGYGIDDGDLVRPNDVSAHQLGGQRGNGSTLDGYVYVVDRALIEYRGEYGYGAGLHKFTRDGEFVARFGTAGYEDELGTISVPGGVVVDKAGRVIVSDFFNGFLHVFDTDGNPVCRIDIAEHNSTFPKGIEVGEDGRLVVALDKTIQVFGIDDYIKLSVSPLSLYYEVQQCGSQPITENITISNEGPGILNWSISTDVEWIVPLMTSGEINGTASVNVSININTAALGPGTHTGVITISAPGATESVKVTVNVLDPPVLDVSPSSMSFVVSGGIPPAEKLNIELSGDLSGLLSWSASTDSGWLSVSPSSGPSGALTIADVSINAAGLEGLTAGEYTGNITVEAGCATGSPTVVPVTLTYIKGGVIKVTTNIEQATFTITGPKTYTGSGTYFEANEVPEGTYTITFGKVEGFKEPASYSLSVVNGAVVEFVGEYKDLRERNNIIAVMGRGKGEVANELRIFNGDGELMGLINIDSFGKEGLVTAAGDIDGDGVEDIVIGHDEGIITGFRADGTMIEGLNFRAFATEHNVDVAVGDLDGDGVAEIIVGEGPKADTSGVRVFRYSGGSVVDTGIYFLAYEGLEGVSVAVGDVDGDGRAEILTTQGGPGKRTILVRIYKVNPASGADPWTVEYSGGFGDGVGHGGDITAGDIDADGVDEIIVTAVLDPRVKIATIWAYEADGTQVVEFSIDSSKKGVDIAAGDIDYDGVAEIVVGEGVFKRSPSRIRIYDADGSFRSEFMAFDNPDVYGVKVSLGKLVGY